MSNPNSSSPPRALVAVCALAFAGVAGAVYFFARGTGMIFLRPLAMLGGWALAAAVAGVLPPMRRSARAGLVFLGVAAALGLPGGLHRAAAVAGMGATEEMVRLMAVVFAVGTFALFFVATLAEHTRRERPHAVLDALIPFCRLLSAALALAVGMLLARLYGQANFVPQAYQIYTFVVAVLVAEGALSALARLYQPRSHLINAETAVPMAAAQRRNGRPDFAGGYL